MTDLDVSNKKILYALTQNARIFDSKIAKRVNKSKESIRYRINKLEEQKIITQYVTWIDPLLLGYTSAKIYLRLKNNPQKNEQLIQTLCTDSRLFWLGIAQGAWDVGLTYFIKTQREFFDIQNNLYNNFSDIILDTKTATLVQVQIGPKNIFAQKKDGYNTLFARTDAIELDKPAKDVLRVLMKNARLPVTHIAQETGCSIDVVRNRMQTLEQQKIIAGYAAAIDHTKIGYDFYKTFVYVQGLSKEEEQRFDEYCLQDKHITHVVKQNSAWNIELEVLAQTYQEYQETIHNLTKEFSETITRVETAIMTRDYIWPAGAEFLS